MKPIKTAICSFGISGSVFHAPFISVNPNFELYGVWERTKNIARNKYPGIKTFRSLEELLADDNIELVVVNTPSVTHYDYAKKVITSGKHLIVEKPFTATSSQARELIGLAKKEGVKLSVYHNRRYDSDCKTVEKVLKDGLLGKVVDAEIRYDRFDPELSYKTHKEIPTEGVGSLYDLGSHLIDQAIHLFGMPKAVFADLDSLRPNSRVVDYFDVKLFYASHRVTLKSSYYVKEALPGIVIHGTKGSFIKPKGDVQEAELQAGKIPGTKDWGLEPKSQEGLLHTEIKGAIVKKKIPTLGGDYMEYYKGIYEAIRNNKPLNITATEAMHVIMVIEAAQKSNIEKKTIDL